LIRSQDSTRIVIVENHRLFIEGLRHLLEEQPGYHVVGEAMNGREALKLADQVKPDILLMDLEIPNLPAMEVLRSLHGQKKSPLVVILADAIDREQVSEAYRLGAKGVVLKESATALLYRCIDSVMAGKYWVLHEAMSDLLEFKDKPKHFGERIQRSLHFNLTKREMEIIASVVIGKSNRHIANKFDISEQTVKHHMTSIFDKLGVYNRLELALFAIHHGLVGDIQEIDKQAITSGT